MNVVSIATPELILQRLLDDFVKRHGAMLAHASIMFDDGRQIVLSGKTSEANQFSGYLLVANSR
jgi:hypothetical protein